MKEKRVGAAIVLVGALMLVAGLAVASEKGQELKVSPPATGPAVPAAPQAPAIESPTGNIPAVQTPKLIIRRDNLLTVLFQTFNENFFRNSLPKNTVVVWTPLLPENRVISVVQNPEGPDSTSFVVLMSAFALIGTDQGTLNELLVRGMISISYQQDVLLKKTVLSQTDYVKKELDRISALERGESNLAPTLTPKEAPKSSPKADSTKKGKRAEPNKLTK